MEVLNSRRMMNIGVMTALYFVLTMICELFAYGQMQFRLSEMLVLLCIYNPDHILSVSLGCFMANMFSPMSLDLLFGTAGTLIAAVVLYFWGSRMKLFPASLIPVVSNAALVGVELTVYEDETFLRNALNVAAGEFVCVSLIGVILLTILRRRKGFMKLVTFGREQKKE